MSDQDQDPLDQTGAPDQNPPIPPASPADNSPSWTDTLRQRLFPPQDADQSPQQGALPTGPAPAPTQGAASDRATNIDPQEAYLSGAGKSSEEYFAHFLTAVEKQFPDATPAQQKVLAIHNMPGDQGTWAGAQYMRGEAEDAAHQSRLLLNPPTGDGTVDHAKVASGIQTMLENIPTGESVKVKYVQDGLYQIAVTPKDGKKTPTVYTLNVNQMNDLSNIGKAGQFDGLYENSIGGTLAALSKEAGTAPDVPQKPAKPTRLGEVRSNTGGYLDRYTKEIQDAGLHRYPMSTDLHHLGPGYQSVPLGQDLEQQSKRIDYMEKLRTGDLEPTQELEKVKAAGEIKRDLADRQGGIKTAGQQARSATEIMKEQGRGARQAAQLANAHLTAEERNITTQAGQYRAASLPVPPALQAQEDAIATRHASEMSGAAPAQEYQSTAPAPTYEDQSTAPAPGPSQAPAARATAAKPTGGIGPNGGPGLGPLRPPAGWVKKPQQ